MRHIEPTPEQIDAWTAWLCSRPPSIQRECSHLDPWTIYTHKKTGQRVVLLALSEPSNNDAHCTVRIAVPKEFNTLQGNPVLDDIQVFGVDPKDLIE